MTEDNDHLNRVFRALGDTTRRRIIDELGQREDQSLFEIYTRVVTAHGIGHSRQAFSRHLSVLEDAGLIQTRWQGTTKLHRLDLGPLETLAVRWLNSLKGWNP